MKVVYSQHLIDQIKIRKFNLKDPRIIFYRPEQKYFDTRQKSNISIKRILYNGVMRQIMIPWIFNKTINSVIIKTIHVEKAIEIIHRLKSGRYIKR